MKQAKIRQVQHSAGTGIPVSQALASIKGKYTAVRREITDTEDVDVLRSGYAYALYVTEPCVLSYGGRAWELKEGWNLIGWGI